jgi:hypothetical protein
LDYGSFSDHPIIDDHATALIIAINNVNEDDDIDFFLFGVFFASCCVNLLSTDCHLQRNAFAILTCMPATRSW